MNNEWFDCRYADLHHLTNEMREYHPRLWAALSHGTMPVGAGSLEILNRYTGLNIEPQITLAEGCYRFINRLKEMRNAE